MSKLFFGILERRRDSSCALGKRAKSHQNEKTAPRSVRSEFDGGDARIRTGGEGFAGLCLTTWPRRHVTKKVDRRSCIDRPSRSQWSGRRGSNPRPRPWQGRALPAEPRPRARKNNTETPYPWQVLFSTFFGKQRARAIEGSEGRMLVGSASDSQDKAKIPGAALGGAGEAWGDKPFAMVPKSPKGERSARGTGFEVGPGIASRRSGLPSAGNEGRLAFCLATKNEGGSSQKSALWSNGAMSAAKSRLI